MIDFFIEWLPLRFSKDWIILNSCFITEKHILYQNYGTEHDLYYDKFLEGIYIYFKVVLLIFISFVRYTEWKFKPEALNVYFLKLLCQILKFNLRELWSHNKHWSNFYKLW